MKAELADIDRHRFEQAAIHSFISEPPRDDRFRLYNKNGARTTYVTPLYQRENRAVWVVEVDEPVDPYFRNVLKEVVE